MSTCDWSEVDSGVLLRRPERAAMAFGAAGPRRSDNLTRHPSTAPRSPKTNAPHPVAPTNAQIQGYGALDATWEAHHERATTGTPGSTYDPDPTVDTSWGASPYRYVAVAHRHGRVISYLLQFAPQTSRANAIARARAELPGDARIMWQKQLNSCYQIEFHSAALATAIPLDLTGGYVTVELNHYDKESNPLSDTSVIQQAAFSTTIERTPSDAVDCETIVVHHD
jgi:hypothetical protein